MKRLHTLTAALATLALAATAFVGCVDSHTGDDFEAIGDLSGFYLKSNQNNWPDKGGDEIVAGDTQGVYSVTFKATDSTLKFKIANDGWTEKYASFYKNLVIDQNSLKELGLGESTTEDDSNGAENDVISGLTKDKYYKFDIEALATGIILSLTEGKATTKTPFHLEGFYVDGNFKDDSWTFEKERILKDPTVDEETGNLTYKYDFTPRASELEFLITDGTTYYKDVTIDATAKADYEDGELVKDGSNNNKLTNLDTTKTYRLYIQTNPSEEVYVKLASMEKKTLSGAKVEVTGLPAALNGKKLYFTGDLFSWAEPGTGDSVEADVSNGSISITLPDLEKEFMDDDEQVYQYNGKFAAVGWSKPEVQAESGDVSFTFTQTKKTLKGVYTSKKDGEEVYYCTWTVE